MNLSSLQTAQLKNKSNILIQNLFNHCFEKSQTSVASLFKQNLDPYSIRKILFKNGYLNISYKIYLSIF